MRTQSNIKISTELVMRDDGRVTQLVNNVFELRRQNQRLALERSILVVAFAITLAVLVCVLCTNAR